MKRIALALLVGAVAATAVFASTAAASGPAPPGKEIITVECEGLEPLTVAVNRNEHGNGAGQIVGEKGHGVLVSGSFSLTDVTTGEPIFGETFAKGGGHAHPNQATTPCAAPVEEVEAAQFFGEEELPPGVSPTDIVRTENVFQVIVKR
ncbi:MAG TPA: hypothetical protein VFW29_04540 [Solirubrobacteraceae bacterium]|nr:hypothetical protein [Solirubrobacteraceae bacterium]